jgi:hypothetical protein
MDAVIPSLPSSFEANARQCLAGGLDTQKADSFLDQLFEVAATSGSVRCTLANERVLRIQSRDTPLHELDIPRAKTKLRMLCARLAVRCGEWADRKLAPHGDVVDFVYPPTKQLFTVRFENTTGTQTFAIHAGSQGKLP